LIKEFTDWTKSEAANRGVELVGPVQCGSLIDKDVDHLNVDDFDIESVAGLKEPTADSNEKQAWAVCECQADHAYSIRSC